MNYPQVKKVWGAPFLLAVLTIFGLLSALLGTGIWYGLAWLSLTLPVLIIIWKVIANRK